MMAIVFITLTTSVVLGAGIAVLAFADVAFRDPLADKTASSRPWQPPMIRGAELFAWARQEADRQASDLLSRRDDDRVAFDLAAEIRSGTDDAIGLSRNTASQQWETGQKCYSMNPVTPPEAMEIGDHIRRTRSTREAQLIADRAVENAVRSQRLHSDDYLHAGICCPLLSDKGLCIVKGCEPLQCRAGCSLGANEHMVPDDLPTATLDPLSTQQARAKSVAIGVQQGMSDAIESTGLDGTIYEFNSALAVALDTPDAAAQWVQGGRLFRKCQKFA